MAIDPEAPLVDETIRRYDNFVRLVSDLGSISLEEADFAARAVIETLAEHLTEEERQALAGRLPKAAKRWLTQPGDGEQVEKGAFLYRVADREGIITGSLDEIAKDTAERHAAAVLHVVRLVLLPDEVEALAERLPEEARNLLSGSQPHPHLHGAQPHPHSRPHPAITAQSLVERVARTARFDHERAQLAVEAVLETLAERLAAGEVDDLALLLPGEFQPALELGKLHSGGKAERFDVDEFLGRVAEREGGTPYEETLDDARFVFRTLRETLPRRELDDILAELPREYDDLLGR
ncbi:MAG: hypothetical protein QOE87_4430 [Gaiellales bacterium]|jgi:uncharacterized protein (DUF2267 family)|nr:hypothetical protein [Gaiellales bacterium]